MNADIAPDTCENIPVQATLLKEYQGQAAWQITTAAATYIYHLRGCGLASLIDKDGNDWISHRPTDGPRGEYRGIPNIIHPDGGFHPGSESGQTQLMQNGPDLVVLESTAFDKKWQCRWNFSADRATMTLTKADHPYWMLYEGTPGGQYDQDKAFMMDSSGEIRPCNAAIQWQLPQPRWICFGSEGCPRMLLLHDKTERASGVKSSFWSMEKAMTVFGFGRELDSRSPRWLHLTETPAVLEITFVEGLQYDQAAAVVSP